MTDKQFICYIFIILTVFSESSYGKLPWGSPCKRDIECRDGALNLFGDDSGPIINPLYGHDIYSLCENSRCKCSIMQNLQLRGNNFVCIGIVFGNIRQCKVDNPETCVNGVCKFDYSKTICHCNEGSVLVGHECRETVTVNYTESCSILSSGPVPICDYENLLRCNSAGKCGCTKSYFYDVESETCISVEAFVEKYPEKTIVSGNGTCGISSEGLPKVCNETANLKCVDGKCRCSENNFYDVQMKTCLSRHAYIKKYPDETRAGLDEVCGISNGVPKECNSTANMKCLDAQCKCLGKFYPSYARENGGNNTCESKAGYAAKHNLSSYKVMPGVFCHSVVDCIEGLRCTNNKCACPHMCTFDNTTVTCDCGPVSLMEGAALPVLVGVIGGFVIIIFWGCMIKKTIDKKFPQKKNCDDSRKSEQYKSVPLREPYRIKTTIAGDHTTTAPASSTVRPTTPVPSRIPSPVPPHPITPTPNREPSPVPPYQVPPVSNNEPSSVPPYPVTPVSNHEPSSVPTYHVPPVPSREPSPVPSYPLSPLPNREPSPVPPYPGTAHSDPSVHIGFSALSTPAAPPPPPYNPNLYPTSPAPYTSNPSPYSTSPVIAPDYSTGNSTANESSNPVYAPSAPPALDIYKPVIS